MWARCPCSRRTRTQPVVVREILCENRFNLRTIFKAILATLERIIRLFSPKWPKSP